MMKIDENTRYEDLTDEDIKTIPEDLLCTIMERSFYPDGVVVMDGHTTEESLKKWTRKSEVQK